MSQTPPHFDVAIVGAGAAGLMCAIRAGQRGKSVLLLDHADEAGKKILISGGGRCNFTNLHCAPDRFLSGNPHFAKSALARYTPRDFVALVDKHGIPWHEKTLGQLRPRHRRQASGRGRGRRGGPAPGYAGHRYFARRYVPAGNG